MYIYIYIYIYIYNIWKAVVIFLINMINGCEHLHEWHCVPFYTQLSDHCISGLPVR